MVKKVIILIVLSIITSGATYALAHSLVNDQDAKGDKGEKVEPKEKADEVWVYYFYNNNRCYACVLLEEYTKKTIEEFFRGETVENRVKFEAVDVTKPENREVARKYGATGSALFINKRIDGEDNIEQDIRVWRLLGNEEMFKSYLSDKITSYLK